MQAIEHLKHLVSFDTQNPPRKISVSDPIFVYLKSQLPGFKFEMQDSGNGCISLLAVRGQPNTLFNLHLDTVPVTQGWQTPPLELHIKNGRAYGLGACDIKGASACLLNAVNKSTSDIALLFSTDEEHGSSTAVKTFIRHYKNKSSVYPLVSSLSISNVVVAEPTLCHTVVCHRGVLTANAIFSGVSGHASGTNTARNAIHQAAKWIELVAEYCQNLPIAFADLSGIPFNVGKINGGIKANMIADSCHINFGIRTLPGQNIDSFLHQLSSIDNSIHIAIEPAFYGASLPADPSLAAQQLANAKQLAQAFKLPVGPSVNFWTEASLFSNAGFTCVVFGPGDIAQAHTSDEWVSLAQLDKANALYLNMLNTLNSIGKLSA
ncbi:acetylornithine deacetylase [Aliikangiella sp. IMCC44632]